MKDLITWFRENVFPRDSKPEPQLRPPPARVRPQAQRQTKNVPQPKVAAGKKKPAEPDGVTELTGRVEDAGPGKNVFVASKYTNPGDTQDSLKIVGEEDELEIDEGDGGIDPYNTGHFKMGPNWKKTFRK